MGRGEWAGSTVQMSLGWAPAICLLPQGQWLAAPPGRAPMEGLTADQALFALELGTPTTQAGVQ